MNAGLAFSAWPNRSIHCCSNFSQLIRKLNSSSICPYRHWQQILCPTGVLGIVCLPVSIRSWCELTLNLVRLFLAHTGISEFNKYGSLINSVLNLQYVLSLLCSGSGNHLLEPLLLCEHHFWSTMVVGSKPM